MINVGVFKVTDNVKKLEAAVKGLVSKDVLVGIPQGKNDRTDDEGKPSPIGNAALGYIHDHGMPEQNIPARPWLAAGIRANKNKIASGLKRAAEIALTGDATEVEKQLNIVGLTTQAALKKYIVGGGDPPFEPLAAATLAARRRRGLSRTKPLIDTSKMLGSISYVVRNP